MVKLFEATISGDEFEIGDDVLIFVQGSRAMIGKIELLSRDQTSAFVVFDGVLCGHVGSLALMRPYKSRGAFREITDGMEVTMHVIPLRQQDGAPDGKSTRNA